MTNRLRAIGYSEGAGANTPSSADTKRLDWLERNDCDVSSFYADGGWWWSVAGLVKHNSLRDAIDAAMRRSADRLEGK